MKKAKYILIEGSEGTGKSTQAKLLASALREKGFKVLETREPGTVHSPLTMILRGIMLDAQYDKEHVLESREMISQAIRAIHFQTVVFPAMEEYDYIIQDRGVLSGLAYGVACGNEYSFVEFLSTNALGKKNRDAGYSIYNVYDQIFWFTGNVAKGLSRAQSAKQEFAAGDSMESKGLNFLEQVNQNFADLSQKFKNVVTVEVDGKDIPTVSSEVLSQLK